MERIDRIGRTAFTETWNVDVKAARHWAQAALGKPKVPGRAGRHGFQLSGVHCLPLSCGYAGAKRGRRLIAKMPKTFRTTPAVFSRGTFVLRFMLC